MSEAGMELRASARGEETREARRRLLGLPALLLALSLAGAGVAAYLTYTYWFDESIACAGFSSCDAVADSKYSHYGDVPVAFLGVLGYLALAAVSAFWLWTGERFGDRPLLAIWGMAVGGVAYSAYLTYIELAVIDAVCIWCMTQAVIMLVIFVASTAALLALRNREYEEE